ncbi:choline kinase family protein [Candidatus Formimonas warabiya]|uniref:Choline kinase n=1 Tax=Formimonas warabiya TaxID=1761012 RepID=A0A3G1KLZ6_FORW1|nr:choline kinase family protein [Candidatus Formimonas warabiya]ATW23439.1 choline kinase [Candidatus Formimonas warabiya]
MEEKVIIDSEIRLDHIGYIYKMISSIPYFDEKRIQSIEPLPGGLTNSNYKVTIDNVAYAIRVAGAGTSQFINRPAEHHNALLMADLGINCPIYYHNDVTGDQVAGYIDGKTLHIPDFHDGTHWLIETAKVIKAYHTCGQKLASKFDLIQEVENYAALVESKKLVTYEPNDTCWGKYLEIKAAYEKNPYEEKPCHNDTLPENWVVGEDKLYLIDWEYAGMNDANFDLAALSLENSLSKEEENVFLSEYYGGEISEENYGRVVINKYLCDYLWALWSVLQIDNGKPYDEYWPYGLNRFNRALAQIEDGSLDKAIKAITK